MIDIKLKYLVFSLSLFIFTGIFSAEGGEWIKKNTQGEKITGAFGYKFGQIIRQQKDVQITEWSFKPKARSPYFEDYYLLTTPLTKKVMGIIGMSNYMTVNECKTKAKKIRQILKLKYAYKYFSSKSEEAPYGSGTFNSKKIDDYHRTFYLFFKRFYSNAIVDIGCFINVSPPIIKSNNACNNLKHPYKDYLMSHYGMRISKNHIYSYSSILTGWHSMGEILPYIFDDTTYWPTPKSINTMATQCMKSNGKIMKLIVHYRSSLEFDVRDEFKEARRLRNLKSNNSVGL